MCRAVIPGPPGDGAPAMSEPPEGANPETVTISIGRSDSVVYLPDETPGSASRGALTPPGVPTSVVGPRASLSHLGLEGGVTLQQAVPERPPGSTTTIPTARIEAGGTVNEVLSQRPGEEKYVVAGELARGGMGVILRAVDRDIRRDVAMKVLLSDHKDRSRERFVEEAQIAGQLEHPNIIPVHDLGVDADGRLFFTMKLVKGKSLGEILDEERKPAVAALVAADPEAVPEYGLRRLLSVYVAVLNAIAFAHDRGVVHRDLKPGNVMVGDFGEVLVMDWGLAKVAAGGGSGSARAWTHGHVRATHLGQLAAGIAKGRSPQVVDEPDRPLATDERLKLLVEGFASQDAVAEDGRAIEGTPAYMAPEQARGELAEVDERSDIYSLGAILYELLTLSPPVRGRSVKQILEDVVAGRVPAPEVRAPERTIPPELAAIAMKALAPAKDGRYRSVVELRRDIELYLDDRQVSAKEDSTWEALVKLLRRNQEVVIAILVCVLIVIGVTIVMFTAIIKERHRYQRSAEEAGLHLNELKQEKDKRLQDQLRAAPALVAKARQAVDLKDFREARGDVNLAIDYDPDLAEARLLSAQLAIRERAWPEATQALTGYLTLRPGDDEARKLLGLLGGLALRGTETGADDNQSSASLTEVADILVHQGAYAVAESLYRTGQALELLYRIRLEKQWPGCTAKGFAIDKNGRLSIDGLAGNKRVLDLAALEGMPIEHLDLAGTQVLDLTPLKRMPLRSLDLTDTPVRSLEPLAGLPLVRLRLAQTRVDDLTPLAQSALEEVDLTNTAVADLAPLERLHLTTLRISQTRVTDLAVLAGMPLTRLHLSGTRVTDLTPLFGCGLIELDADGTLVADLRPIAAMRLTSLRLSRSRITDLTPLRGMPLTTLEIADTAVSDLAPLAGMPLTVLDLGGLPIADLTLLAGMPLTTLGLQRCPVTGLESLAEAKLSSVDLAHTKVTSLRPLSGMPLTSLDLTGTPVVDLRPLERLPLASLVLDSTLVDSLEALREMPLKDLRLSGTRVTDLRPLGDERGPARSLERLVLPPTPQTGLAQLRRLANLARIGRVWDGHWAHVPPAADFWAGFTGP